MHWIFLVRVRPRNTEHLIFLGK